MLPCLTLLQIHELGNPKAKRPDDIPEFYEVGLGMRVSNMLCVSLSDPLVVLEKPWVFVCMCVFELALFSVFMSRVGYRAC